MTPTVASYFSGCGGLDFGFKNAGFSLDFANEIEPRFGESYKDLCESDILIGDFWKVRSLLPETDVIIGGPPCQSFSLVGKRLEDDPRGKLVSGFEKLISDSRPRGFLIENVPGLASSKIDGLRIPELISTHFRELGYEVLVAKVNSADYFVPQLRKRLVILGVREPITPLELVSPDDFAKHLFQRTGVQFAGPVSAEDAFSDLPTPVEKSGGAIEYRTQPKSAYSRFMRLGNPDAVTLQNIPTMSARDAEYVRHIPPGGNYTNIPDDISSPRILRIKASGGRTTTYGRLHPERPSHTLNTYFNRPNVGTNYHYKENRLITVREALRLQSFPDSFTPHFKNQRELHIQIGNAVPPLLAEALALTLLRSLG